VAEPDTTRQLSDPQDPLPEANWLWRRIFIFVLSAAIVYLVYGAVNRLGTVAVIRPDIGIPAFVSIVKLLVLTINFIILCYMVAPSAEQITKLVKTASLLKSGVQLISRAKIRTPEKSEETEASAGLPAEAPKAPDTPESLPDAPWAVPAPPAKPSR
jgi:predicted PurR-regulated permease PerM